MLPVEYIPLWIWLASAVSRGQVLITEGPDNQVVLVNTTAVLRCRVEQNEALSTYIFWDECISQGDGSCRRISNDDALVYGPLGGDPNREIRYSVDHVTPAQFNLVITNVQPEDAGRYRCAASNADVYSEADIIVIEQNPDCHTNFSTDGIINVGDYVVMTCSMTYEGRWPPRMHWMMNGEDYSGHVTDESVGYDVSQTVIVRVQSRDDGAVFSVCTNFPISDTIVGSSNRNNPNYNYTVTFQPLNVHVPMLTGIHFSPSGAEAASAPQVQEGCDIWSISFISICALMTLSLILHILIILHARGRGVGQGTGNCLGRCLTTTLYGSSPSDSRPVTDSQPQPTADTKPGLSQI